MKKTILLLLLALSSLGIACKTNSDTDSETQIIGVRWKEEYDFDGDGLKDKIEYTYSGGAHGCYKIALTLSRDKKKYDFPFEIDGGYLGGLDLSKPDHFFIDDYDKDGLFELYMEINTYNGEENPIPEEWKRTYGIQTNYIILDYYQNDIVIRDFESKEM